MESNVRLTQHATALQALIPWAVISFLLLAFRAAQRFVSGSYSLSNLISAGVLFASAIWLLMFPLIAYTNRLFNIFKLGWPKFFALHLLFAILYGVGHTCLFVYLHNWIWPGILSPENDLSALNIITDLKLNFLVYWLLLGGMYIFSDVKREPPVPEPVDSENVAFVKAMGNYVVVHRIIDGKIAAEITRKSMNTIQGDFMGNNFLRIHRSFLVNRDHVKSYRKEKHGTYLLVLTTGDEIPSSREKKDDIRAWLTAKPSRS